MQRNVASANCNKSDAYRVSRESKNFKKGEGETIYQLRPHLSQMRTTEKPAFWKKYEPIGGGAPLYKTEYRIGPIQT